MNGKSIVDKKGAGMVVTENGDSYIVKIYRVMNDIEYKNKIFKKPAAVDYDIVERVVGLASHLDYYQPRRKVLANYAMINIIYLLKALTNGKITVDNYENLKEMTKIDEFENILNNYLGKERTERILEIFKKITINVSSRKDIKYDYTKEEAKKGGSILTVDPVHMIAPGDIPDVNGKRVLKAMIKKEIYMLLEIIYGLYYTGRKYMKNLDVNLADTIMIKFKKINSEGKEILKLKDIKMIKEQLSGEFKNSIERKYNLDEKTEKILLELEKTKYSSVFGPEFMTRKELRKLVDGILEEYESIMKLEIRDINKVMKKEDMQVVIIANEFKIEDILEMLNPKNWIKNKKKGQTKITDFLN